LIVKRGGHDDQLSANPGLDKYRIKSIRKLIDSGATLKDIQSLVEKMATESESLSAATNAVAGQNRLTTIIDQSLTLASMEIAKFNSGHYIKG